MGGSGEAIAPVEQLVNASVASIGAFANPPMEPADAQAETAEEAA
jgi:hypothetical protein